MNKKVKVALILIAIILIATLAISVAYSRYFTEVKGTGTATVAKWSFEATSNGTDITSTPVDLAQTRTDTNTNVKTGTIAPGTEGEFNVEVDATGTEVALDYEIKFGAPTGGTLPANLKFYKDDAHTQEVSDLTTQGMTGTIDKDDANKTKTVTLYWKWDYQTGTDDTTKAANDVQDTTDGQATTSAQFDIIITGKQKQ